jgi:hypothetical protein
MENITPAKRALAVLDNPPPEIAGPPQRISKKVRAAIGLMVAGEGQRSRATQLALIVCRFSY